MTTQLATITSVGGLLPPDLLARIVAGDRDVPGIGPSDYGLDDGITLREAISRAWNRLVPAWRAFVAARDKLPKDDPATTVTREKFLQPLFEELRFGRVAPRAAYQVDDRTYAITHAWGEVPIHMLGAGVSLDTKQAKVAGAAKSSPHGLVQDFLNRSKPHLWAIVTNGLSLRLLRDHHSLTTQAYVDVDLEAMFEGNHYADFALAWMVFHQSRFEAARPEDCWLEKWFTLARDQGVAALDDLRGGVERAIEALGRGFLRHKDNAALRDELRDGGLDKQEYYRELLRLVYRCIFLFSTEERDVLLDPAAEESAKARYRRFYATRRLRELAGTMRGGPHGDLWQGLMTVMRGLDGGCAPLALPALGSFLWSPSAVPHLGAASLANEDLLTAMRELSYLSRNGKRFPVAWRTVAADELGGIYEGLLELHPSLDVDAGAFELETAAGHERKKTGSYYTPTSLVDCLLDTALDPVVDAAVKGKSRADAEAALLALKVVDPACGSGHFLVAAARRMARRLATVRTGDDEPSPPELRHALRDVIGRCVYGVDLNEMAVELCKVALWMEAIEPGRPLSFLDAHVQHGNALLGATPALIERGVPDEAWEVLEGDDKAVAKALKKRNREERKAAEKQQGTMFAGSAGERGGKLVEAARAALEGGDGRVEDVKAREDRWARFQKSREYQEARLVASAWCAAFVWRKAGEDPGLAAAAPTYATFASLRGDATTASARLTKEVRALDNQYLFFHWHLQFPDVFGVKAGGAPVGEGSEDDVTGWTGGFDVVLGNPPWEHVELKEIEWFAARRPAIAKAENAAKRKKLIAELATDDPALFSAFRDAVRALDGQAAFARASGRYPLTARGRVNTYALFAELDRTSLREGGRAGSIFPSGIATDDNTKEFFGSVVARGQLASLYHFENEDQVFPAVHHAFRFCLFTIAAAGTAEPADLVFYARSVAHLAETGRHFQLTPADFLLLNPNTRTCPTFRWTRDAEINKGIYRRLRVLLNEGADDGNPWGVSFMQGLFNMASDSGLFRDRARCESDGFRLNGNVFERGASKRLPLYEAKMVHHFDHRFATYEGQTEAQSNQGKCPEFDDSDHRDPSRIPHPYYWVDEQEVSQQLAGRWSRSWLVGWRDIARASDMRTVIAAAIPAVAVGHKLPLLLPSAAAAGAAGLYGALCSLVFDYAARQKVGGTSLTYFIIKQLPMPTPAALSRPAPWDAPTSTENWLASRVLELTFTSNDMVGFATDVGYAGPPFRWDPERRAILRAELDAAFFHLYGLDADDTAYILDTFPVLRDKEVRQFGEYRTRRLVLERYAALADAIATRTPYVSPLNPPPASPLAAHQPPVSPRNVIPLHPHRAPVPVPVPVPARPVPYARPAATKPDMALVATDAWARSREPALERGEVRAALLAVLRAQGAPMERAHARLAALLCLEPHLLLPLLEGEDKAQWVRVVGADAQAPLDTSVDQTMNAWGPALTHLRANGRVLEDLQHDSWEQSESAGSDESGWPEGRASFVVNVLHHIRTSKPALVLIDQFPTPIRHWVRGAA